MRRKRSRLPYLRCVRCPLSLVFAKRRGATAKNATGRPQRGGFRRASNARAESILMVPYLTLYEKIRRRTFGIVIL